MNQPREAGVMTMVQFEEYRKGVEQRFAAQERAVDANRVAVDELTKTHAAAHEREHVVTERALREAREVMDDRLKKVEEAVDTRLRKLEDLALVAATKDEVKVATRTALVAIIITIVTIADHIRNFL